MLSPRWQQFFSFRSSKARLSAGAPAPLGATWDGRGTNFALFSANATKVELCLFDSQGRRELERDRAAGANRGRLARLSERRRRPASSTAIACTGPTSRSAVFASMPHKLLVDPYAKRLVGHASPGAMPISATAPAHPRADLSFDRRDNARGMPKAAVIDEAFTRGEERRPLVPWEDTIIYEAHVKGLTQLRDDVPPAWRGKFRGLTAPAIIDHLKRLGVTTLELLPIHAFVDDRQLVERGLSQLLGLQHALLLRARAALCARRRS